MLDYLVISNSRPGNCKTIYLHCTIHIKFESYFVKLWATSNTCQCCQPTYYCNLKRKNTQKTFSWKFWIDLSKCPILLGYREQLIKKFVFLLTALISDEKIYCIKVLGYIMVQIRLIRYISKCTSILWRLLMSLAIKSISECT